VQSILVAILTNAAEFLEYFHQQELGSGCLIHIVFVSSGWVECKSGANI
jgi:hypothetical protein